VPDGSWREVVKEPEGDASGQELEPAMPCDVMGLAHWGVWEVWAIWVAYTDVNCAMGREPAGRWERLLMGMGRS